MAIKWSLLRSFLPNYTLSYPHITYMVKTSMFSSLCWYQTHSYSAFEKLFVRSSKERCRCLFIMFMTVLQACCQPGQKPASDIPLEPPLRFSTMGTMWKMLLSLERGKLELTKNILLQNDFSQNMPKITKKVKISWISAKIFKIS